MIQELITYLIIAIAVAVAVWKTYNRLSGSKKMRKKVQNSSSGQHHCSDCVADCSLRDAAPQLRKDNAELCETTVKKAKDS